MKKIFSFVLVFILLSVSCLSASAEFVNPSVVDGAGYLTEDELSEISVMLDEIRAKYNFDVSIYTEADMSGYNAETSADDIYDYNLYGAGESYDGIMLYICLGTREYQFTTCGKGIEYFTENGLIYLEAEVYQYLTEDDYYGAFKAYAETCDELVALGVAGTPYDEVSALYYVFIIGTAVLIALLIALIMMLIQLSKMRTAVKNDYAADYMKAGSMNISVSRDMFLYSRITKTPKPKQSSSSGSGTHTSSSGRTHGSRGGSF